jgi:hypothetical protein
LDEYIDGMAGDKMTDACYGPTSYRPKQYISLQAHYSPQTVVIRSWIESDSCQT